MFMGYSFPLWVYVILIILIPLYFSHDRRKWSSPAPHVKTFKVFLIHFPKCPSFSTIKRYVPNCAFLLIYFRNFSPICWWKSLHFVEYCFCHENSGFNLMRASCVGRHSSVSIATRYGLGGPGIESRWGRDFPRPPDRLWGPPSLLYSGYRVILEVDATGPWCWPPASI